MLTRLKLKNFKSWSDTRNVKLKPITGFFGANSSGKTSLLQALLLLKQTSDSADRGLALQFGDKSSLVDLGDFRSVIHGHAEESELLLELDWRVKKPFLVTDPKRRNEQIVQDNRLGFMTKIRGENGASGKALRLVVPEFSYRVGNMLVGMQRKADKKNQYELHSGSGHFQFIHAPGRIWPLPPPNKCYGFPDQVRAYYQNAAFLSDLELAFEEELRRVYYLGPLRAYPERTYTWDGAQPSEMGQAGEKAVNAIM